MRDKLKKLKEEALSVINSAKNKMELTELENRYFGRKAGELTIILRGLKDLAEVNRKSAGELANEVKSLLEEAINEKRGILSLVEFETRLDEEKNDVSQPSLPPLEIGHYHPNTLVQRELEELFTSMGFMILDGPELESEYYNFTAVNVPPTHPARDMQDTFYIKNHPDWVMRTQTSAMQVRAMQKYGAPLRAIVPGKCYRNESTDSRHEHTFYHLEGLAIDKEINFSHLKGVMGLLVKQLYGSDAKFRLRPKYFPFVEPGVNGEVTCFLCHGVGCRVCKNSGWLEIVGAGMIHPNVLKEGNIDPKIYQGFAFGFGLSRLVMLKYGIEDVRLLESGDLRFIKQF